MAEFENQPAHPDRLLSKRETAQYLGVCEMTVHRLARRKALRSIHVAGRVKFRWSDIQKYLERRTVKEVSL